METDIYGANIYNQILEGNRRSREKKNNAQQIKIPIQKQMIAGSSSSIAESGVFEENPEEESRVHSEISYQEGKKVNSKSMSEIEKEISNLNENGSFVSDAESIQSILVCTGVYQGSQNEVDAHHNSLNYAHKDMVVDNALRRPSFISSDVYEAVKLVYKIEKFDQS